MVTSYISDNADDSVGAMLRCDRRGTVRQRRSTQRDAAEHPGGKPARHTCQHRQKPGRYTRQREC